MVRTGLSDLELSELLVRRKKIYEMLHPATIVRNLPGHASNYESSGDKLAGEEKPYSQNTAEKMDVSPYTVERHVQIAENLTPKTKEILRGADMKITKQNLTKLSRLESEQQAEAAKQLQKVRSNLSMNIRQRVRSEHNKKIIIVPARLLLGAFSGHSNTPRHIPENHKNSRRLLPLGTNE